MHTVNWPWSVSEYKSGQQINSISRVARPSPKPTTSVDLDDGLFLFCPGTCTLCFALIISSSAVKGMNAELSSQRSFPQYVASVVRAT